MEYWGASGDMEAALEAQMAGIVNAFGEAPDASGATGSVRIFEGGFQPRKMCQHFDKGRCNKGDQCTFAHSAEELHPTASAGADFGAAGIPQQEPGTEEHQMCYSSTQGPREFEANGAKRPYLLCQFWLRHPASCAKGDSCTYAHGLAETGMEQHEAKNLGAQLAQVANESIKGKSKGKGKEQQQWGAAAMGGGGFGMAVVPGSVAAGKGKSGKATAPATTGSWGKAAGKASSGRAAFFAGKGFSPNKMCGPYESMGMCNFGDKCTFAHSVEELSTWKGGKGGAKAAPANPWEAAAAFFGGAAEQKPVWSGKKTKMCTFYENGACTKDPCTFAHSPEELVF